jgi:C4-dicarboxylate-specific signal transduction histidine kinase
MDRIVGLFERDARQQVTQLRLIGFSLAAVILLLLASLGRFVVRPATTLIRTQLDELVKHEAELCASRDDLEVRVAERTRQLSEANAALRSEMTERERAEQHARRVLAQLAHVSRVRVAGQLATGLAHELNQPLGAVANSAETAELLLERETPDLNGVRGSLRRIRDAALRAGAIIRRMRNFLRPAARERVVSDLDTLIAEAAELCATECVQAGIAVARQLDATDATVEVDPIQIQQVFVNLVQNAIQAMCDVPQAQRRLTVRTHLDHGAAVVEVADHGPGFADPEAALGAFYSSKPEGLGLGLAISRSIVEDHGGRLWIDAAPGRGARVLFSLPFVAGSTTPSTQSRTELVPSSL